MHIPSRKLYAIYVRSWQSNAKGTKTWMMKSIDKAVKYKAMHHFMLLIPQRYRSSQSSNLFAGIASTSMSNHNVPLKLRTLLRTSLIPMRRTREEVLQPPIYPKGRRLGDALYLKRLA